MERQCWSLLFGTSAANLVFAESGPQCSLLLFDLCFNYPINKILIRCTWKSVSDICKNKCWVQKMHFCNSPVCSLCVWQESDGEKSDDNLVVDVSNEVQNSLTTRRLSCYLTKITKHSNPPDSRPPQDPSSPRGSPAHSPRENGLDKRRLLKKDAPLSPSSIASSSSTPSSKSKEMNLVSHLGNYSPLIFCFIISLGSFLFLGIYEKCILCNDT